jgi:hypothetical protein
VMNTSRRRPKVTNAENAGLNFASIATFYYMNLYKFALLVDRAIAFAINTYLFRKFTFVFSFLSIDSFNDSSNFLYKKIQFQL